MQFYYFKLAYCLENKVDLDQLASVYLTYYYVFCQSKNLFLHVDFD